MFIPKRFYCDVVPLNASHYSRASFNGRAKDQERNF